MSLSSGGPHAAARPRGGQNGGWSGQAGKGRGRTHSSGRFAQQPHASISGFVPPTHQPPAPRQSGLKWARLGLELDAVPVGIQASVADAERGGRRRGKRDDGGQQGGAQVAGGHGS
ncbi:hypothetical protein ACFY5K_36760 [Streptomyces griseofuscus]|uniref:hypothetical protein n=1 Tax=Streptomyces griseofuscus TaxID=146922 RepID=UPI0036C7D2AB